jgi:DNA-binding NtrC family response regulator
VSRLHATVSRETGGEELTVVDRESRNGTFWNGLRVDRHRVRSGDVIRVGNTLFVAARVTAIPPEDGAEMGIIGRAQIIHELRQTVRRIGKSALPVLVTGPTGTGKELVAHAIHNTSGRPGPFVAINCAALPRTLVENLLFGHRKGAYTDAVTAEEGAFAKANGGTLFLDEVGEMPPDVQPKLLRALENGEVTPVGATQPIQVDVRVVAATNRDLEDAIQDGRFRADIYARLAGVVLRTPPLADRREDVLLLWRHFLPAEQRSRPMAADFAEALLVYPWPRHVRQLRQLASRSAVLHPEAKRWELEMLDQELRAPILDRGRPAPPESEANGPPSREELVALLEQRGGNVSEVARLLGRNRKQVYRWIEKLGLPLKIGR